MRNKLRIMMILFMIVLASTNLTVRSMSNQATECQKNCGQRPLDDIAHRMCGIYIDECHVTKCFYHVPWDCGYPDNHNDVCYHEEHYCYD